VRFSFLSIFLSSPSFPSLSFPSLMPARHVSDTRTDSPVALRSRSFARIHRTNLAKQGVLPLTLASENDYSLISAGESVRTSGLNELLRGDLNAEVNLIVTRKDGVEVTVKTLHGLSQDQVLYIVDGSALNGIKRRAAEAAQQ
jgi:aconitase A